MLRLVLWPTMWAIFENHPCVLEKSIMLLLHEIICICFLGSFGLWFLSEPFIYGWNWGIENYYYCMVVCFSLQCYQCLPYIFRCLNVGSVIYYLDDMILFSLYNRIKILRSINTVTHMKKLFSFLRPRSKSSYKCIYSPLDGLWVICNLRAISNEAVMNMQISNF